MKKRMNKHAQVWVETVIYTLIALALIGLMLAFAKPKIEETRDRMLIEQTIDSLNKISEKVYEVQIAPGNRRPLSITISKGRFFVDPITDQVGWILESHYKYSELGKEIPLGKLNILTEEDSPYKVTIYTNYSANITLNGLEERYEYEGAPAPYSVTIENKGRLVGNTLTIDLEVK